MRRVEPQLQNHNNTAAHLKITPYCFHDALEYQENNDIGVVCPFLIVTTFCETTNASCSVPQENGGHTAARGHVTGHDGRGLIMLLRMWNVCPLRRRYLRKQPGWGSLGQRPYVSTSKWPPTVHFSALSITAGSASTVKLMENLEN